MIKRITKITGLLISAASIISIVPAYAADIQKLDAQSGTIYSAKANGNGIFIDGEINGDDEAVYWISDDGQYDKLDVETGSSMIGQLMNKYLEIDTRSSDLTYVDITNGYKDTGYDVREDLEATVARTLRSKIRHDDDGRFDKSTINTEDFTTLYNRENSIKLNSGKKQVGFVNANDGLSIFQVPLKDDLDDGISNSIKYNKGSLDSTTSTTVSNTSAVYADANGNYVDADYNLGSLKICEDSTTGSAVTLKDTDDSYKLESQNGTTYELKAVLTENNYIGEVSDDIYRLANLTIYKKEEGDDDSSYTPVTEEDGFKFGGKLNVDGTTVVLQKFSKTPASDTIDGIKYSKNSTLYFISDKDGNSKYLLGKSGDATKKITNAASGGSAKIKAGDKNICSMYLDTKNNKIYAETLKLKKKNNFNYVDIGDYDSSDIDSTVNGGLNPAGAAPCFINSGYIMMWDGEESFKKFAKIDSGISSISSGGKSKMIAWDEDKEVYSIITIPKEAAKADKTTAAANVDTTAVDTNILTATTGAAVTVSTTLKDGWTKNNNNTWSYIENGSKKTGWLKNGSTWYYLKTEGVMSTGWIKDGSTWYYLKTNGAMATGWLNDNGAWYYLNESGAMLSDTIVDGYRLDVNGVWV